METKHHRLAMQGIPDTSIMMARITFIHKIWKEKALKEKNGDWTEIARA